MGYPTKAELKERIQKAKEFLKPIVKNNLGHPNPEVHEIISLLIETLGALDGRPEHDV